MTKDRVVGSTILSEHRGITNARYILAVVNFIAILVGTILTSHFVSIRGASDGVVVHINIMLVVNVVQIGLCLADYIVKQFLGIYFKYLPWISYGVGGFWLLLAVGELVAGSRELGDLRLDLAIVLGIQLVMAFIAYVIWPSIDHSAIQKLTSKRVREQASEHPEIRAKKARAFIIRYVIICLFVAIAQVAMLFAYKVPPRVYDLFSDSRALQYKLNETGDGYIVTGVYIGTSSYANIPATYNDKPVVGVSAGAFSNVELLEKNKISRITFGTEMVDDNGNTVLVSNVKYLERNAISNDKITTITLPSSIVNIEDGAIESSSLTSLIYQSKADFSISYLDCDALESITMSGEGVGNIVSLQGMDKNVTIEVAKEIYNDYRKNNAEYVHSFRPILPEDEFCVDFYTDCDYYIESIFAKYGQTISIGYNDLKNDAMTGISPAVDTLSYIRNKRELGTNGAKKDSAFRGWYSDASYGQEIVFTEAGTVSFNGNTSIYAKWIDEYTGTLDWGTFQPVNSADKIYWTDEDVVELPIIDNRIGYTEGVIWRIAGNNAQITNTRSISENKTFEATWILDKPTNVDIVPSAPGDWWEASKDGSSVMFTYDELNVLDLKAKYSHPLENDPLFEDDAKPFTLSWKKVDDNKFVNSGTDSVDVQNVADSGKYVLTVTFRSPYGEVSSTETDISVSIGKKALDIGTARLDDGVIQYTKVTNKLSYTGSFVHTNIQAQYFYYDEDGTLVSTNGVTEVGRYTVKVVFSKNNDAERSNYQTKELQASFEITPRYLTFEGWSNTSLTYNGQEQGVELYFGSVLAGDEVSIIYKDNATTATNAGSYVAEAIGVSNPNYSLDKILSECRTEWTIAPKAVTVKEWTLDNSNSVSFEITYNGRAHRVSAVMDGALGSDTVNFVYDMSSACKINATNAGTYTARVLSVDNDNYVYTPSTDPNSELDWKINKKQLTATFTPVSGLVYDGSSQGIVASISGVVSTDIDKFDADSFLYDGKSASVDVTKLTASGDQNVKLGFSATNASSYTASISSLDSSDTDVYSNYTITAKTQTFEIEKKPITIVNEGSYTYTGLEQSLKVYVDGIISADIAGVTFSQFGVTNIVSGARESDTSTRYALTLKGTNAGAYSFSVDSFSNSNYELDTTTSSGTVSIAKKALSFTRWQAQDLTTGAYSTIYTNADLTYNKNGYTIAPVISGMVNGETVNLSVSNGTKQSVGSYTTTASLPSEYTNYTFSTSTISWEIEPYVVDFGWTFNGTQSTATIPSFVYNAGSVNVAPKYSIFDGDSLSLTYAQSDMVATDVGEYQVEITSVGNANYVIGDGSAITWKITQKPVTVTWPTGSASSVYNGMYQGPSFTLNGLCEHNDLMVSTTANGSTKTFPITSSSSSASYSYATASVAVNAGTYDFEIKEILKYDSEADAYVTDNNYVVIDGGYTFNITKRPLVLTGAWTYSNTKTGSVTYASAIMYNASAYTLTTAIDPSSVVEHLGSSASVSLVYSDNAYKDASTYTAKITGLNGTHADNYSLPTTGLTKVWTISPKPITLEWGTLSYTYNGSTQSVTASVVTGATSDSDGKVYTGDSVTVSGYTGRTGVNAGSYTAVATRLSNSNYCINETASTHSTAWTISPKEITLTWGSDSFTYNKSIQYPSATYIGEGNTVSAIFSATPTSSGAGDYNIVAVGVDNENYVLASGQQTYSYTISPKPITISWRYGSSTASAGSFTYDATTRILNAVITNAVTGDTVETIVSGSTSIKNAGSYTCNVIGVSNPNYTINGVSNLEKTIVVSPAIVSIAWTTSSFVYDRAPHTLTATVTGVNGEALEFDYTDNANRTLTNVGSLTVSVASVDDPNYTLTGASYTSKTLTVSAKTLTLVWSGTSSLIYDGKSHTLDASLSGICSGDTVELYYSSSTVKDCTNAGSYTITVSGISGASSGNYTLSSSNRSKTLTISKRALTVTWDDVRSYTYDGNAHTLDVTLGNIVSGDSVGAIYSTDISYIDAGSYVVKFTGVDNTNYSVSASQQTLTISPKQITLVWPTNKTFTYDGASHSINPTVSGVIDGESVTLVYASATSYTDAGSYVIEVTGISDDNYEFASNAVLKQTMVISPKTLTLTWPATLSFTYDGTSHSINPTVSGVLDGESVSLKYSGATSYTNAGEYDIVVTGISDDNYQLASGTTLTKTMTIAPKTIALSWPSTRTFTYDGKSHSISPTVSGTIGSESVALEYETSTTSYTNAGSYSIVVTGTGDDNYVFASGTVLNQTMTINPKTITVTWPTTTAFIYDGTAHSITPTVSGAVSGEVVTLSYASTNNTLTSAGTKTVKITGLSSDNYVFASNTVYQKSITVNPATVTITWPTTTSFVYNGSAQAIVPTVTGVNGESIDFTYANGNSRTSVGSTSVTVVLDDSNYTLEGATGDVSKTLTITPRAVSISWSGDTSVVYDGASHSLVATVKGVGDESVDFTYVNGNSLTNVGSLSVAVVLADSNYTLVGATGDTSKVLTISQQEVIITWSGETAVEFDGEEHSLVATVVGKNDSKSVAFTYSANDFVDVGTWSSTVSLSDPNYVIANAEDATASITISKASIGITWDIDTEAQVYNVSADRALADGVTVSYTITKDGSPCDKIEGAGDYVLTATLSGDYADNYVIESGSTTSFTIAGESLEKEIA